MDSYAEVFFHLRKIFAMTDFLALMGIPVDATIENVDSYCAHRPAAVIWEVCVQ